MTPVQEVNHVDLKTHFAKADSKICEIVERVGPVEIKLHKNYFRALVESILSQQVSTRSAAAVIKKVEGHFGQFEDPEPWTRLEIPEWRALGVSRQKAGYMKSLSEFFLENREEIEQIGTMPDEAVIELLTRIKGIGEWTAHMFLMFALGRPDVLAHGDLGIKSMVAKVYGLEAFPDRAQMESISQNWKPYRSVVQVYLWRFSSL